MDTLVLDPGYKPIDRISWQRAISLFFMGKVEIVEEYEDKEIKSVTFAIKMPSVVRFIRAMGIRRKAIKFSRDNVYMRDKRKCQYCGAKVGRHEFTYDHVLPKARGGMTEWTNIVVSCYPCNRDKQSRTPEEAGMQLLSVPIKPKKLPERVNFTLTWKKGDPETWKSWLASVAYWHSELEE